MNNVHFSRDYNTVLSILYRGDALDYFIWSRAGTHLNSTTGRGLARIRVQHFVYKWYESFAL